MRQNTSFYDQAQHLREQVSRNERQLKLITVTSGKGGVGKTSLTVNLALALQQLGHSVLVVDADFGLANIDVMLGLQSSYNLSHLLRGQRTLGEITQRGALGVRFISGGSGVFDLLNMNSTQLDSLLDGLMGLEDEIDIILFDTGAGINENILRLIMASSETVVVTTPEPTAILDAYALVKTVSCREGAPPTRMVMNKADSKKEADNATAGFQSIIRKYLQQDVESLGYVLFDAEVSRSIKRQIPILVSHPGSMTARCIQEVARRLAWLETGPVAPQSPLGRLFARLKR